MSRPEVRETAGHNADVYSQSLLKSKWKNRKNPQPSVLAKESTKRSPSIEGQTKLPVPSMEGPPRLMRGRFHPSYIARQGFKLLSSLPKLDSGSLANQNQD